MTTLGRVVYSRVEQGRVVYLGQGREGRVVQGPGTDRRLAARRRLAAGDPAASQGTSE